jgi:uncharacterized lipoprotein YddW (UPF0748 family)
MDRREFLQLTTASMAVLPFRQAGGRKHFLWLRPDLKRSADDWKREFDRWRAAGITGIIPEVYNGRNALFRSARLPVRAEWLEQAIPIARAAGIDVHAWMWCMPCNIPEIIQKHPDWYNVNALGESAATKPAYVDYYKFLDPAHPDVREFVRDTVRELAAIEGLTGIHLDYIRHPDAILPSGLWAKYGITQHRVHPPYDYGYTELSRKAFKDRHGIDPITLKDPETNREWLQYRLDSVVDLVNEYLVPAARTGGKQISAAVFPGPSLARTMVRQDWGRFNLDAFFPMLYHGFYEAGPEWVRQYTREAVRGTLLANLCLIDGPPCPPDRPLAPSVFSGLYVADLVPAQFTRTIEMALEGGARGVSIFDAGAMTPERWALFAKAVAAR